MNKFALIVFILIMTSCSSFMSKNSSKVFVVERDREAVYVVDDTDSEILDLGNLNHATIKFKDGYGYILARNGYITKFDKDTNKVIRKVQYGKSGIGLTFAEQYLVIVNYDPKSVMFLDHDLNLVKTVETGSRNVGVKSYHDKVVFSLMDKNEIWVLDLSDSFSIVQKIENVGLLPFDALINENYYVVGFFNEPGLGVLNLENYAYKKVMIKDLSSAPVMKVPHFGYWGKLGESALVPLAKSNKIISLDLKKLNVNHEISLVGSPVFAAVSPDKNTLVVNYSGDKEDFISIVDLKSKKVVKTIKVGRRVMHFRYVDNGDSLYVSSYFDNKLTKLNTKNWEVVSVKTVPSPSGIFIDYTGVE